MVAQRTRLRQAIDAELVPRLRAGGFVGAFPHYRRLSGDRVDLVTVRLGRGGDTVELELGAVPPGGLVEPDGQPVPPSRMRPAHLPEPFFCRMGAAQGPIEVGTEGEDRFAQAATAALAAFERAERWWAVQAAGPEPERSIEGGTRALPGLVAAAGVASMVAGLTLGRRRWTLVGLAGLGLAGAWTLVGNRLSGRG